MSVFMRLYAVPQRHTVPVRGFASKGGREIPRPQSEVVPAPSSLTGRVVIGVGCLGMILLKLENDKKEAKEAAAVVDVEQIEPQKKPIDEETLKIMRAEKRAKKITSITTDPKSEYRNSVPLEILRREVSSDEAVSFVSEVVERIVLLDGNPLLKESLGDWVFLLKNLNDKSYEKFLIIMIERGVLNKLMSTKEFYYSSTHFRSHLELKADLSNFAEGVDYLSKK